MGDNAILHTSLLWSAGRVARLQPVRDVRDVRDVRVKRAQRGQITWRRVDFDAEVPADHEVRAIAAVVDKIDLRGLYADVRACGEIAGAPAIDPRSSWGSAATPPGTALARSRDRAARRAPRRLPLAVRRRRSRLSPPQRLPQRPR
jgi:hypothetical protein